MNVLSSPRTASTETVPGFVPKPLIEQLAMGFGVIVPFLGLIAAVYLTWGHGVGWTQLALLFGFYTFTILGITIGYHRMCTHRALESGPVLRGLLAIAGSMSAQGPVLEWCSMHPLTTKAATGRAIRIPRIFMVKEFGDCSKGCGTRTLDGCSHPILIWCLPTLPIWSPIRCSASSINTSGSGCSSGGSLPGVMAGLILHSWVGSWEASSGAAWFEHSSCIT